MNLGELDIESVDLNVNSVDLYNNSGDLNPNSGEFRKQNTMPEVARCCMPWRTLFFKEAMYNCKIMRNEDFCAD